MIIYGVLAEVSIGALFLAAVLPGMLLAVAFAVGVVLMAWLWPSFVGNVRRERRADGESFAKACSGLVPVVVLIVLVLGGIYGGVFTPTEAGAAGALGAMVIALLRKRRSTWPKLWEVMSETGQVSVSILFLIIAASMFSRMLTLTELPQDMAAFLGNTGLGLPGFLAAYLVLLLVLGMLLDSTSIMLIMLPLALPVATALGAELIWFGIVTTIAIEIGLLTPPFGLSVYVIKASMDDPKMTLANDLPRRVSVRADHARRDDSADGVPADRPVALSGFVAKPMIDLYTWTTPNGRKVSIMLEEIGMPYRAIAIDINAGEQLTPEFLKISPNNKIPAIVDHDTGLSLMESGAILLYLGDKAGKLTRRRQDRVGR